MKRYKIERHYFNGYVCLCCYRSWPPDVDKTDSLEEALQTLHKDYFQEVYNPDYGLQKIRVTDTATNKVIAYGKLSWPYYHKYNGNKHKRWSGRVENNRFEQISTIFKDNPSWRTILRRCKIQEQQRKAFYERQGLMAR